ncbi:MAG: UDP-N-acetylglucosamine-1-phosphate transferase [Methanospirillaceae archaeon]|nr:UDP-N-acetylglucosamine-1-phosphate transferase [Methanospirillaceae archaeon]
MTISPEYFLLFLMGFFTVLASAPLFIRKFTKNGFVVPDMYKEDSMVPTMGGMVIIAGILVSLIIAVFLVRGVALLLIFYFIVFTYAMFGILDDLIDVGRQLKIIAPFFMAIPIALLSTDTTIWLLFWQVELGALFLFLIAPLFVMVISNLINMHSGFNGMQSGLSLIITGFLIIQGIIWGYHTTLYIMPLFGALCGFYIYNRYPSRIFEGNVGSLAIGSAVGAYIILMNMEILGIIIFIPHIINFLMYAYWRVMKLPATKFGTINRAGNLVVPNYLTLKWVIPYFFPVSEKKATRVMFLLTALFGLIGLVIQNTLFLPR